MICLHVHPDWSLRNNRKQANCALFLEPSLRQLAAHIRRVEREEALYAIEDCRKRKTDLTGHGVCDGCGARHDNPQRYCRSCKRPFTERGRHKSESN